MSERPLQGDGETILVRVVAPPPFQSMLMGTPTVFSRAKFPDGSEAGVRLHVLRAVMGQERLGVLEIRTGFVPKGLGMGDAIELVAGGVMRLHCVVAE